MSRIHRSLPTAARIALGAVFFVFGLNGFLGFLPQPPLPPAAGGFIGGLASSGYFFPLLKLSEVIVGALLLSGRFVPLALTVAAPIVVNILAFHLFLAPAGSALPVVMLVLEIALAWWYRDAFRSVVSARAAPSVSTAPESTVGSAATTRA